jgi:hypothetical protein
MGEAMDKAAFVNAFRKAYLKNAPADAVTVPAAPQKTGNFDFMEEGSGKKKKKKDPAADTEAVGAEDAKPEKNKKAKEPTAEEVAPEESKKKKKNKKEKDEGLLPDVDLN